MPDDCEAEVDTPNVVQLLCTANLCLYLKVINIYLLFAAAREELLLVAPSLHL